MKKRTPAFDHASRWKKSCRKRRLNQVVLEEFAVSAGGHKRHADFSDLVGCWTPDPAFDEILASQRRIDRDKWN